MKQKEGKKTDCEPHQALLQIVVCSCQVLHWLSSSLPYVCVGVCFSPPYDRVLQCGVTRASGLCFFPFVQGKFFKSRTKNQHRCAFCPIDPLFPLPHQRLLDAVVLNPATLHLSLSLAASAASASRLPRGPCQGVRAVKNQPLPQTLTSKSIRVPFSDQFVKAPLGSRGPERVYVCPSQDLPIQSGHSDCPTFDPTQTATSRHRSRQLCPVWAYIILKEVWPPLITTC